MKNSIIKAITLIICMLFVLSCFGCSDSADTSNSSSSKLQQNSSNINDVSSEVDNIQDDNSSTDDEPTDIVNPYEEEPSTDNSGADLYEVKAKIDNTTPLTTKYMGCGSGVYYCYPYMPDSKGRNATDEQIKIELDRLQNMGVHTVRTLFNFKWVRDEKAETGWDWDNANMKGVYRWLQELQDRNIDVIMNPWNFMWLVPDGEASITDTDYFRTNDFTENSKRWCNAVTELFKQLRARGYMNAKYLMMFTEPIYARDKTVQIYDYYIENAKRIHTTLEEAKIRNNVLIVGPNRSDADTDLLLRCINEADETFDIYTQHQYLKSGSVINDTYYDDAIMKYQPFVDLMRSSKAKDKPFWIDEYGIQDASVNHSNVGEDNIIRGVQQAVGITACMNMGIDNVLLWTFADQLWPGQDNTNPTGGFYDGVSEHGLLNNIQLTMVPKSQYYSYSLLTKYTGRSKGKTFYSAPYEEYEYLGVTVGCVQTFDGDWTIVVTNNNLEEVRFSVDIAKSLGGVKLYRHQYVAAEVVKNIAGQIIPANKTIKDVKTGFADILRPNSVAVYTTIKG